MKRLLNKRDNFEKKSMIPHKLQLKNFLSYGPQLQTIDFSRHSLICLSGKNGHGKSALLDAMTWAIWGQARKIIGAAKADQGLLRLGQTQMLVIFDFEFNSTLYRIRREYMETFNKPIAVLEFGTLHAETQEFISLTDKTIRATQTKIEQTLRLDFESFINSAFLRQGNSNEFSKKTPKDRKHILASILGLDQYEAIRKQGLEKIKDASLQKTSLIMLQEKRIQELSVHKDLNQELNALEQELKNNIQKEKEWHEHAIILKKTKHELELEQQKQTMLIFQKQQLENAQLTHITHLKNIKSIWRTINAKKQHIHSFQQLEQNKKNILAHIAQYQKMFQLSLEQKEELLRITQELNTVEQAYKNDIARKQQSILIELERLSVDQENKQKIILLLEDEYKKNEYEVHTIAEEITKIMQKLSQQTITEHSLKTTETLLEKRKNAYQTFVSQGNWINNELKNSIHKRKLIHVDDPSCPLCEQNLSTSRKRLLNNNFSKQESFLSHRLQRLKRIIPIIKENLVLQHEQLLKDKELFQQSQQMHIKIKELNAAQEKIAHTNSNITTKIINLQQEILTQEHTSVTYRNQLALIADSTALTQNQHYQSLVNSKQTLKKQIDEYAYNPNNYTQKQAELNIIEQQLLEYESLQKEIAQQHNRTEDIHKLCVQLKELKREINYITTELHQFNSMPDKITALQSDEKQHAELFSTIRTKKETLLQVKGSIETEQKRLTKVKNDYEQEQKTIMQLDEIIQDYQIICTATGKDGIQALLIEEAIPEIEQETNQLLSQLTNNQAQIFIESLRDLKKGGTKETLDIKISDQNGIRPYELFSGGEAFRIDFALRIAISKLLARRAGTALQTLIIDEGFGSQDDEGLSHIMDALHIIQNNFSKIIVVSHLPAMKDQFPVQFVIQKGVQGSTITVVEQG